MNPPSETKGTKWQVSKPSPFKVCRNGQGDLARRTRPDWPFGCWRRLFWNCEWASRLGLVMTAAAGPS